MPILKETASMYVLDLKNSTHTSVDATLSYKALEMIQKKPLYPALSQLQ